MIKKVVYVLVLFFITEVASQELIALYPINYPKTDYQLVENGTLLFEQFDIRINKGKEVYYKEKLIYSSDSASNCDLLIEHFSNTKNFLFITPLPQLIGSASPYSIDREIVLIFDYVENKQYYADLNNLKGQFSPKAFEYAKDKPHVFMIKDINTVTEKLVLLQGGQEIQEVQIDLFEF